MFRRAALSAVVCLVTVAALIAAEAPPTTAAEAGKTETTKSGLKITYVAPGDATAKDGDLVSVLYTGKLADGTVFDASSKHGGDPIDLILGQGLVIKGWEEGLQGMKVGEKRTLVIPPDIAYGAEGRPPVIPRNATLTFDVELVGLRRMPPKAQ